MTQYSAWVDANRPPKIPDIPGDKALDIALAAGALHATDKNYRRIFMPGDADFVYIPNDLGQIQVIWYGPHTDTDQWAHWFPTIIQRRGAGEKVLWLEDLLLLACNITTYSRRMPEPICQLPVPAWIQANGDDDARLRSIVMFQSEAKIALERFAHEINLAKLALKGATSV